ncbi:MAG: 6-bladed beta-propeller [Candidatus Doudnabacteria bacterium]
MPFLLAVFFALAILAPHKALAVTPDQISGLKLWMDASNGVTKDGTTPAIDGDTVQQWNDRSLGANNATQLTAGSRPTYKTNIINSHPVLRFNGAQNMDTSSFLDSSFDTSFTFFIVQTKTDEDLELTTSNQGAAWFSGGISNSANAILAQTGNLTAPRTQVAMPSPGSALISDPTIETFSYDGTHARLRFNGSEKPGVASGNLGLSGALTIGSISGGGYNLHGDIAEIIIYNSALSRVQIGQIESYLMAKYGIASIPSNPLLIFDGDSITQGYLASTGQDYPSQVQAILGPGPTYQNMGGSSRTLLDMINDAPAQIDPEFLGADTTNIVTLMGGTNDLHFGADAITTYNRIVSYAQARRAVGFKVIVNTILPRTEPTLPTFEADRQTVNSLLRANWPSFADGLSDIASSSVMGQPGEDSDTTYYHDGIHPTDAGYGILAGYVAAAIQKIISPVATSFTSVQDGNWNDGATWGNTSPGVAGADFPGPTDNATVENTVTLTQDQSIQDITVSAGSTLNLAAHTLSSSGDFTNNGTVTGDATFNNNSSNNGTVTGVATFNDTSVNSADISGNPVFNDTSQNSGTITGNPVFNDTSANNTDIIGNPIFNDTSSNAGTVTGDATFTYASGGLVTLTGQQVWGIVNGRALDVSGNLITQFIFRDQSANFATISNNPIFYDSSYNQGTVTGDTIFNGSSTNSGTVTGNAVFNDSSYNPSLVSGDATFTSASGGAITLSGSQTWGRVNGRAQDVSGNLITQFIFNDTSRNDSTTITGDVTFNDSAFSLGTINGDTIFNDSSTNDGFINGNPVFNGLSENLGSVTGNPTFNDASGNFYTMDPSVVGNASFKGTSINYGTVNGNACFAPGASNFPGYGVVTGVTTVCSTFIPNVSASFTSVQDGNWNDGATWGFLSPGAAGVDYPNSIDDATIENEVAQTQDQSVHDITISGSGTLDLGANTFFVSGNFNNNGILNAQTSTVVLNGTNQTILGPNTFHNLTKITNTADTLSFDPANTTTLTGTLTLTGVSTGLLTVNNSPGAGQPVFDSNIGRDVFSLGGNLNSPVIIANDSSDNMYVLDRWNNRIEKFDPNHNFLFAFGWGVQDGTTPELQTCTTLTGCYAGLLGSGDGEFNFPQGIAVDYLNNIYVADSGNNRIQKFDSAGNYITQWGSEGSGPGQFEMPDQTYQGIATDSSGNVYVADSGNNRIQKFDSSGNFQSEWGTFGTADNEFNFPQGIAVDHLNNIYVADYFNHRIQKFDSAGNFLGKWGSNGSGDSEFGGPTGINADSSNDIYVTDYFNDRVQKFNPAGGFLLTFGWGVQDGANQFEVCTELTIPCRAGLDSGEEGAFQGPVTISSDSSFVYVSDDGKNGIQKFDFSGNFISKFVNKAPEKALGYPSDVAFDASGNIYITDSFNNRIQKFDSGGNFLLTFGWGVQDGANMFQICTLNCHVGIPGSGNGEFSGPTGLAFDSSNNLYVVETDNNRIQKFHPNGNSYTITSWGSPGSGDGQFNSPQGIAIDSSDNIYVADSLNNRVEKFDPSGNLLLQWGSPGSGEGQFSIPSESFQGIATDSSGNIYVTDIDNNRIEKFDSDGNFLSTFGWGVQDGANQFEICTELTTPCQAGIYGSDDGQLANPQGIAIDSSGNIYVTDADNNRVQKFDPSGNFITQWGSGGPGDVEFSFISGIAIDSSGSIYVADTRNGRIQKFTTGSSAWTLDSQGSSVLSYLSVSSSHATSVVTCTNCIDGGGNINWNFGGSTPPPPPPPPPSGGGGPTCCAPYVPPGTNQQASNTLTSDGSLLLDHGVIYVMSQGFKRPFVSMAVFTALGYKLSNVIRADTSAIPEGESILSSNIRHPVGALILNQGTVYLLGTDLRYGFPSEVVFYSYGYQFKDVLPANSLDLLLPQGPIVQMNNSGQVPSFPSTGGGPAN